MPLSEEKKQQAIKNKTEALSSCQKSTVTYEIAPPLIFIKESSSMQSVRIHMQDDATRHFFTFLTTEDIPFHDE
jgi:hypothetical protein